MRHTRSFKILAALLLATVCFGQGFIQTPPPYWYVVAPPGALATRPVTCTPNFHVFICNGAGCGTNGEYHFCTAANTWTVSGSGAAAGWTYNSGTNTISVVAGADVTITTQSSTDNSTKAASTAFVAIAVANAIAGVNPAVAVQAATTAASDTSGLTYANGAGGIGATLTGTINTAVSVDGYTFTATGQRLLVKNDTQAPSGAFNGVYSLTQLQTIALPPIFMRASDYNQPSDMNNTGSIPVVNGTANALTSWLLTSAVTTVGTDPLTYSKFSVSPSTTMTQAVPNSAVNTVSVSAGASGTTFVKTPVTIDPTTGTVTIGATVLPTPKVVDASSPVSITVTSYHACDVAGGCTYTLPAITAANLDLAVCVWNKAGRSGAITFQLPAATQMDMDGVLGTAAATLVIGGELGAMGCAVAQEAGVYKATINKGTGTNN